MPTRAAAGISIGFFTTAYMAKAYALEPTLEANKALPEQRQLRNPWGPGSPGPEPEPRALGSLREFLPSPPGPGLGPPEEALMGSGALTGPRGAPDYLPPGGITLARSSRRPPRDSTGPRGPLAPRKTAGCGVLTRLDALLVTRFATSEA